jgi:UDP-N-acetyl-D-mannosaminuronic acid transferase (WecB/TagA/CpsF family)
LGLEWLHRLVMQPQRWRRIWTAVVYFSWLVLRSKRESHNQNHPSAE